MAGKPQKKFSLRGVSIRQLVEEIPEGCSTPDFEQKPVTLALQEGKNAIFRAVVWGEPRPEVRWQSTKGDLSNCSKYQISSVPGSKEHVLQINKLTGEDTDLYRCTAVNAYGEATCSARLTVIEVGFRKNRKRQKEPQEDLRKELMDFRSILKKRAPSPPPKKKLESEQVWQLLMTADRKDYEKICMKYGIVDFRGMLRKLQEMKKEREDKVAQYINVISNLRHIRVTKDGLATFDLELDLKDLGSKIYLYKDGEMIPYGFNNQTKHCLKRLGKRYHFQIQDLQPEDAGLYQVIVEDAVVFSTELEASAIPPRVVVPLAEARCEEQGDAVFECTLSSPCPSAAWQFQHRPLQLSDKYEVLVSPDGLTHRLVVRGVHFSDMGLYSLSTRLHTSSAWLVVEAGKDKGPQTTGADLQLQTHGAQASDAEDSRGISGGEGKLGELGPRQSSLQGAEPASGFQFTAGPDRGGINRHGHFLMGDEGAADSAWGPGQERKGFLEAEVDRVTLSRDNQPHLEGDWGESLPGSPHLQERGPESRSGFMERQQQGHGRGSNEDRRLGTAGGEETGSSSLQAGGLGSHREKMKSREDNGSQLDRHGQEQLWDTQLGPGTGMRAVGESQSDPERSWLKGEVMEILQGDHLDEMGGGDGVSREKGRGAARAVWASGTYLGEAGDSSGAGGPRTLEFLGGRVSSSKAGMGPESWGSQRCGDADHGEAGGYWESGEHPGQTSGGKHLQESLLSGGRKLLLGSRSPEAKAQGSLQGAHSQGPGTVVGERDYKTGPGGPGDPRHWEGSPQELWGRDHQDTAEALGRMGDDSRSLQPPQSWTVEQRGAGDSGRTESESTGPQDDTWSSLRKIRTHFGPGGSGSSGGEESVSGAQVAGQGGEARNHRLVRSPGLGAQGSGGTLGDTEGLRDPGAVGSKPDFWNGSGHSREKGPRGEMGCKHGSGGPGQVEARYGDSPRYFRGVAPGNGAAYSDGSGVPGETGCGRGIGYRVVSGVSVGTESEQGGAYRHDSGAPGGMWSGNRDHCGPAGRGSGRVASLRNGSGGPDGVPMDEVQDWDASQGRKPTGPGGGHHSVGGLGSPGTVGSLGVGSLKASGTVEMVREGHVEAEPGGSGRTRSWGQTGDYAGFGASGTLGASGEGGCEYGTGGPGAMEPGSLGARGKEGDGDGIRSLGARASGDGSGYWDNTRHPEALVPHAGAGSDSQWAQGSGSVVGYGDRSKTPEPQGTGDRTAYGRELRGLGPGRTGPGSQAGFRDASGGLRGMGPAHEAGYKNGIGGSAMGSGGEAGYRDGIEGSGDIGSRGEAGYRDGIGGSGVRGSGGEAGYRDGIGVPGIRGAGSEAGYRDGIWGSGATGSGGEGSYRNGIGGSRAMGLRGEAGYKDGIGSSAKGSGGEAHYRDGIGGSGTMASGGEAGYRDGGSAMGSRGEAGYRGGIGVSRAMGSGGEAGYRNNIRGLRDIGSEGEAGYKDGIGVFGARGPEGETGYRNEIEGSGAMGSEGEACYRNGIGGSRAMKSGGEAGYRNGIRGSGDIVSGGKAGYTNALGGSGKIPLGNEAGYKGGLENSGDILSWNEADFRDGLGGAGGMGSRCEVGYRGVSGGSGEMGLEGEMYYGDSSGRFGGPGSLAGMKHEAGPRDHETMGPSSGYWAALEDGTSSKDGPDRGGGMGFTSGAGPGVSSGMAGALGTGGGTAHKDSPMGPGMLGTQGGPQTLSGGQSSKNSRGSCGSSGIPEALGAVGSTAKPGIREWQDGSGIPGRPRDRGSPSREGGSAGQTGARGTSRLFAGSGTVEDETCEGTAVLESGHDRDFWKADSGTTFGGRVAGQRGVALQGGGDSPLGGRRRGAGSGSSSRAGQIGDSGSTHGGRGKSTTGPDDGQGVSHAWTPGWEDQELGEGSIGTGNRHSGSRAPSSLQENDATFRQTHEEPGGSRGPAGQEATGECQGPWGSLESKVSGPRRGRSGGAEDSGVRGKGNTNEWGDGLIPKPGQSGPQGAWNGLDGPFGGKGSGGRSGGIQDSGSQLGKGQGGGRGSLREQGSLEAENGKLQGPRALREFEGPGAEESGGSGRRPDSRGSRCQAQSGVELGTTKRGGTEEARGMEWLAVGEDGGHLGETQSEDGSRGPHGHIGSRRGAKEGRLNICGEGQGATQNPRSRYQPSTGSSSTGARGRMGHFSQGLADMEVQLGEAATLSCTLTSDLGPGTWFKDGVELTTQDGVIFEQDGLVHRLLITHVQGTQAGKYTFVAGNQQSEATLTIQDPPTIAPDVTEKLREPLVVKAGKPVTVKIPFQSRLPVQAAWRKDGAEVVGSSHRGAQVALGDDYTRLCLPSVNRKDGGQYSVTLKSEGGSVQAELTLQVIDKPQPPQGPLEVQDGHRADVYLRWRPPKDDGGQAVEHYMVERRQAGRSTWLKVGESPPDSTTFTDASVEQGKKYTFRVRAVTSEGSGDALESEEVLVVPEALPGPPSAPAIQSASSQHISLTWMAPQGPGSAHILGYLIEKRKKGSNTWAAVTDQPVPERRYTVVDVRQGCQYEFRVTAMTPSGHGQPGPPSDAVFARDPMRSPGPVQNLQVTDTSNTSITLSWAAPDAQERDKAQGYVVELCSSDSLQWNPCHVGTVPGTTFTAKGLRPRQGYFVRVTAVNDGGHGQPTALDTPVHAMPVTVCPKFLMDSTKDLLTVRVGDSVRVPVSFEAAPMPEVTWLKDGLPLPKRSVTTTKDDLTQLLIPAASLSDSGRYTVMLRDLQGKEAAYNFLIRVAGSPQAPGPIHLQENVPGTVTAQWDPSPDEAQAIPLHYTVLMRSSSHGTWHEVADRVHTNRFTFLGVLPGHEYHFRVVAKNELGASKPSDTSQPWCIPRQRDKFTVKAPSYREPDLSQKPRFLVGLRTHLLPPGSECHMTCAVQGSPRPRVTWFKNGQSLEGNPALYSTDMLGVCSLVIPSVSPKDSGEYKAVAENPLGQAVSTATLIVTDNGDSPGKGPSWQGIRKENQRSSLQRALRGLSSLE